MTDWIDYTQCSECGKQCQNGGHCIGGMGGKDTKCPGFIRYVPKIRVEKDVWESTLHRSMVLQAENDTLKEKIERLEKQYDRAKWWLNEIVKNHRFTPISTAEKALKD